MLTAQAKVCVERGEFTKAEALYVRAKKPELAVKAYKEAQRWNDATRIAREFLPHRVGELQAEHQAYLRGEGPSHGGGGGGGGESAETLLAPARALEEGREFSKAIDAYLSVTAERAKSHDFLEEVHLCPPSNLRVTALLHHHEPTPFPPHRRGRTPSSSQ